MPRTKKIRNKCLFCNNDLNGSPKGIYCNNKCQQEFRYQEYIKRWKKGLETGNRGEGLSQYVRRYLFEKYNNKCCRCGWKKMNELTGKIPLTVEHIDGHWWNTIESNLKLLCPNCHSLTETYGSLNIGNGRSKRIAKN